MKTTKTVKLTRPKHVTDEMRERSECESVPLRREVYSKQGHIDVTLRLDLQYSTEKVLRVFDENLIISSCDHEDYYHWELAGRNIRQTLKRAGFVLTQCKV